MSKSIYRISVVGLVIRSTDADMLTLADFHCSVFSGTPATTTAGPRELGRMIRRVTRRELENYGTLPGDAFLIYSRQRNLSAFDTQWVISKQQCLIALQQKS